MLLFANSQYTWSLWTGDDVIWSLLCRQRWHEVKHCAWNDNNKLFIKTQQTSQCLCSSHAEKYRVCSATVRGASFWHSCRLRGNRFFAQAKEVHWIYDECQSSHPDLHEADENHNLSQDEPRLSEFATGLPVLEVRCSSALASSATRFFGALEFLPLTLSNLAMLQ